jgi:predicted transcriptional regulator of viral defense system
MFNFVTIKGIISDMSAKKIRKLINKSLIGKPFTAKLFLGLASNVLVRKVLSRMVESGEIKRLYRGVYVRPKFITNMGEGRPPIQQVIAKIIKLTGETVVVHPAESLRILKLSTQVPMRLIYYTNGTSRTVSLENGDVVLKHVGPKKLVAANSIQGHVFSALINAGKNSVSYNEIKQVESVLSAKDFKRLYKYLDQLPTWLADLFFEYKKKTRRLNV